jgi:hypothetical protein
MIEGSLGDQGMGMVGDSNADCINLPLHLSKELPEVRVFWEVRPSLVDVDKVTLVDVAEGNRLDRRVSHNSRNVSPSLVLTSYTGIAKLFLGHARSSRPPHTLRD